MADLVLAERIEKAILLIRGEKVMLDADLAKLYGVSTKALVQGVKRNLSRFPFDFMFQLTKEEHEVLRSQIVTSKKGRGGRRYPPYAFTEHGVAMLSSVLNSVRAIQINIEIVRAFVRLRQLLSTHSDLARKLEALEKKYDEHFQVVFEAIRQLMIPPENPRRDASDFTPRRRNNTPFHGTCSRPTRRPLWAPGDGPIHARRCQRCHPRASLGRPCRKPTVALRLPARSSKAGLGKAHRVRGEQTQSMIGNAWP